MKDTEELLPIHSRDLCFLMGVIINLLIKYFLIEYTFLKK
jgi:hypothetical protein